MKILKSKETHIFDARKKSGFTLIEVLTVIAIISILMTAGAIGLGNISAGKDTASAVATCESLFDEARVIAVAKRCKARVMVKADSATDDDYLQRVVVIHEEIDEDGNAVEDSWVLSSRGYIMPTGVFYSQDLSESLEDNIFALNLNGKKSYFNGKYIFYEFNAEGISNDPGATFVLGAGTRGRGQEPRTKSGERDFAGFAIWRNGRTSAFRNPTQIPGVDSLTGNANF